MPCLQVLAYIWVSVIKYYGQCHQADKFIQDNSQVWPRFHISLNLWKWPVQSQFGLWPNEDKFYGTIVDSGMVRTSATGWAWGWGNWRTWPEWINENRPRRIAGAKLREFYDCAIIVLALGCLGGESGWPMSFYFPLLAMSIYAFFMGVHYQPTQVRRLSQYDEGLFNTKQKKMKVKDQPLEL